MIHSPVTASCDILPGSRATGGAKSPRRFYSPLEARVQYVAARVEALQASNDAKPTHRGLVRLQDAVTALTSAQNELRRSNE